MNETSTPNTPPLSDDQATLERLGIDSDDGLHAEPEPAAWDAETVDHLLEIRARAERRIEAAETVMVAAQARLQARHEAATRTDRQRMERIDAQIDAWHRAVLDRDPRRKTIRLPNGTVRARAYAERVKVLDAADPAVIEWATEHAPETIRSTVLRTDLARRLTIVNNAVVAKDTGERVDWATVTPAHVAVTITTDDDGGDR